MKPFKSINLTWLLLVAIVISFLFPSCANPKPDDSTTTFQTSSQNKQHNVPTIVTDSLGHESINGQHAVDDSVAVIKPTWGQSIYYQNKSGNAGGIAIGIISILLFLGAIFAMTKINGPLMGFAIGGFMLVCLGFFIWGFWGKAQNIRLNNTKEIDINVYRATVQPGFDSRVIWESLYEQNLLIGAASK